MAYNFLCIYKSNVVAVFDCLYLWLFPLSFTNKLLSFQKQSDTESQPVNHDQIQIVAFSVLGIYLLFHVVSDFIYWATILFVTFRDSNIPVQISLEQKGQMIATVFELIFVVYLLLGTNGVIKLLHRFRYGKDQ